MNTFCAPLEADFKGVFYLFSIFFYFYCIFICIRIKKVVSLIYQTNNTKSLTS